MTRRLISLPSSDADPLLKVMAAVTAIVAELPPRQAIRLCFTVAHALARQEGLTDVAAEAERLELRFVP